MIRPSGITPSGCSGIRDLSRTFLYCHQYLLFLRCSAPSDSGTFPCPPPPKQSVRCTHKDASEISLIKESFKVYPLFSYQGSDAVPKPFPRRQPVYYITFGNVCQQLFLFSFCEAHFSFQAAPAAMCLVFCNQLDYIITYIFECQPLFSLFFSHFSYKNRYSGCL